MRNAVKKLAHGLIKLIERAKGFEIPDELPLRTKLAFLCGTYEKETSRFIHSHVKGGIAIDVGAHIGYYSRLLSPLVEKVYAFEPDPANYSYLVKNTQNYENIIPLNIAVSDASGTQPFFLVKNSTFRHSLIDEGGGERIIVNAAALDDLPELKDRTVSFVKIDVEGHEQNVLAGMRNIIAKSHPLIIAEMPLNETYMPVSATIGGKRRVRNYIIA
jgi:FkbM family methyltransferase